jgi:hypothetical protein
MKSAIALVLSAFLLAGCGGMDYISEPANSKLRLSAQLSGDSPANGSLSAAYSPLTQILQWELSYRGLSGPVTWAFLDGPDGTGAESELVPINLADESNPHPGSVVLTAQQANDLLAGRWSVVLKTEQFPRGEIKGALVRSTR